jgi:DNA-directed RNA polymerase subunit M
MTLEGHKLVEKEKEEEIVDKPIEDTAKLPKEHVECPKCGNKEAYTWFAQVPMAESTETKFYECTKCKFKWRDDQDTTDY